uniref:Pectate lyase n=1 Tax=Romanomermis culicivorax TaxID=13658 RepID=A0A915KI55_ROMCU
MMVTTVVGRADVGAIGGSDVALGGNYVEDQVACSRTIRGAGGNRTLNTGFSGFFKASKRFWIRASPCNGLIYHCDNNWAVGINDGAVSDFDFATYGSCSNCLSNAHLTRLEDNTEH